MEETGRIAIGALSKHTGTNIETIRYYERVGLLPAPARSSGGYRLYGTDHLKRLNFIRPLAQISPLKPLCAARSHFPGKSPGGPRLAPIEDLVPNRSRFLLTFVRRQSAARSTSRRRDSRLTSRPPVRAGLPTTGPPTFTAVSPARL